MKIKRHIIEDFSKMMCLFIFNCVGAFCERPRATKGHPYECSKILIYQELLTCFFNCNCNASGHTDHGVVICADERSRYFPLTASLLFCCVFNYHCESIIFYCFRTDAFYEFIGSIGYFKFVKYSEAFFKISDVSVKLGKNKLVGI